MKTPVNIVFARTGTAYGPNYTDIFVDMVRRNLRPGADVRFTCITDQPEASPLVRCVPSDGYGGWFDKLSFFRHGLFPAGSRVWSFDLDVAFVGPLDRLLEYDGPFMASRDIWPYRGCLGSCPMTWRSGEMGRVLIYWEWLGRIRPKGGDQEIIDAAVGGEFVDIEDVFPGAFVSYKRRAEVDIPAGACIVNFHGEPKPHQVRGGWVPWVWRIGGGLPEQ